MEFLGPASIFYGLAIIGSAVALLFLVLMFFGLDDVLDGYFVQRIAVAFACGFGWMGVILLKSGWTLGPTLIVSILVGLFFSAILVGTVIGLKCLAQDSPQDFKSLVGHRAEVIASSAGDFNLRVNIMYQGRLQDMMATKGDLEALPLGSLVKVDQVTATGKLLVSVVK